MGFSQQFEYRYLCEEYNLYADLTVRVFVASNDLPELVLPDGSVAFGRPWERQSALTFILINNPPRTVRKTERCGGGLICGDVPRYTITVSSILKRVCP